MERVRGLDVLRSVAIFAVVLYHYPKAEGQLWLRALSHYGWAGVDLFFVLSGYLIAGQLFSRIKATGNLGFRSFYLRRFLRTLPPYFAVLGIYVAIAAWNGGALGEFWKYALFLQNFGVPFEFSTSWSLCVEEHFYLLFPVIVWAILKAPRPRTIALVTFFSVVILSVVFRFMAWKTLRPDLLAQGSVDRAFEAYLGGIFYPSYGRLDGLAVGVGLAAIRAFRPTLWQALLQRGNYALAGSLILLAAAAVILRNRFGFAASTMGFLLLSLGFGLSLVASVSPGSWLGRLRAPGANAIAVLSYSMYLTHVFALTLASGVVGWLGLSIYGPAMAIFTAILTYGLARIFYGLIEGPSLSLRDRLLPR